MNKKNIIVVKMSYFLSIFFLNVIYIVYYVICLVI